MCSPLPCLPEWFWFRPVQLVLYSWDQLLGGSRNQNKSKTKNGVHTCKQTWTKEAEPTLTIKRHRTENSKACLELTLSPCCPDRWFTVHQPWTTWLLTLPRPQHVKAVSRGHFSKLTWYLLRWPSRAVYWIVSGDPTGQSILSTCLENSSSTCKTKETQHISHPCSPALSVTQLHQEHSSQMRLLPGYQDI